MTKVEKCIAQLKSCDIHCSLEDHDGTVYVWVQDIGLQLSDFEIDFRAGVYDEEMAENS